MEIGGKEEREEEMLRVESNKMVEEGEGGKEELMRVVVWKEERGRAKTVKEKWPRR